MASPWLGVKGPRHGLVGQMFAGGGVNRPGFIKIATETLLTRADEALV